MENEWGERREHKGCGITHWANTGTVALKTCLSSTCISSTHSKAVLVFFLDKQVPLSGCFRITQHRCPLQLRITTANNLESPVKNENVRWVSWKSYYEFHDGDSRAVKHGPFGAWGQGSGPGLTPRKPASLAVHCPGLDAVLSPSIWRLARMRFYSHSFSTPGFWSTKCKLKHTFVSTPSRNGAYVIRSE